MTALNGSIRGTRGTSTMPAPSLPRAAALDDEDRLVRTDLPTWRVPTTAAAVGTVPQASQYPPTIVPTHPSSVHAPPVGGISCADATLSLKGAVPHTTQ
ncbi:hypothetical protein AB0H00_19655 [Nocardia sp. NPDC023852]|uniref:hypothetical protein n=1 Tax=Nocardia sp. NPDC023852 TaxID=3154697 RepID=UPI0033FBE82B